MKKMEAVVLHISFRNTLIASLALLFLTSIAGLSSAALNMDEIRYLFEKEKGSQWESAPSQERRDFIRDVQGREEFKQEVEYKGKVKKAKKVEVPEKSRMVEGVILSEEMEEKAPFHVRESFKSETGLDWGDADKERREEFWKDLIRREAKEEKKEVKELKKQERLEKQAKKEREKRKKEIEKKRKQREKEAKKKEKEKEKKRKEEEKKLKKAQKKMQKMRKESQSKH